LFGLGGLGPLLVGNCQMWAPLLSLVSHLLKLEMESAGKTEEGNTMNKNIQPVGVWFVKV
jgi:hypothetical protein